MVSVQIFDGFNILITKREVKESRILLNSIRMYRFWNRNYALLQIPTKYNLSRGLIILSSQLFKKGDLGFLA